MKLLGLVSCGASMLSLLSATAALAQDKPTIDTVHWLTAGAESAALQILVDAFEARGGVWIDSAAPGGGADASAMLMSRIAGGNPPSAMFMSMGPSTLELGEGGVLRDVTDVAAANGIDHIPPVMVDLATGEGHLYALPIVIETQNMMWYSIPVFADAGVEVPKSWDEFLEIAPTLKEKGYTPIAVGAQGWQLSILFGSVVLGQGGIDFYNKVFVAHDAEAAGGPDMVHTFEILRGLADNSDAGASNRAWNDTLNLVAEKRAAMQIQGSWAGAELLNMGLEYGKDWGCALPPGNPTVAIYGTGFEFPVVNDANQVAGQDLFIQVMMDPAIQAEFAKVKGAVPARLDADQSGLTACDQLAAKAMGDAVPVSEAVVSPNANGQIEDLLSQFWSDPSLTAEAAAAQFASIISAQ